MKKISLYCFVIGLFTFNILIPVAHGQGATNTAPLEDAQTVLFKALQRMEANNKGQLYGNDKPADLLKVERMTLDMYMGVAGQINGQNISFETVSNIIAWSQFTNPKTISGTSRSEGTTRIFINGTESPKTFYQSTIDQFKNGKITTSYLYAFPLSKINQETITDRVNQALIDNQVPNALRKKVISKITNSNIKLSGSDLAKGAESSLGFETDDINHFDPSGRSGSVTESVFIVNASNLFKLKTDLGTDTWTKEIPINVYSSKTRTQVSNMRKMRLTIDADKLAQLAVSNNLVQKLVPIVGKTVLSSEEGAAIIKKMYTNLEIEVWIEPVKYEIHKIYIPQYTMSLGDKVALSFELSGEYTGPTSEKRIKVPTKFLTPAQIKKDYTKYLIN